MRARVVWRVLDALTVPTFAVTRQSGQAFVFVVRPVTKQAAGEASGAPPGDLGYDLRRPLDRDLAG